MDCAPRRLMVSTPGGTLPIPPNLADWVDLLYAICTDAADHPRDSSLWSCFGAPSPPWHGLVHRGVSDASTRRYGGPHAPRYPCKISCAPNPAVQLPT
jgi:hypothetical protein